MLFEGQARDDVARGDLVPVLEEFSAPFPGFYLYYPQRRHASPPLRALIDHLRDARRPSPPRPKPPTGRRGGAAAAAAPLSPGTAKRR